MRPSSLHRSLSGVRDLGGGILVSSHLRKGDRTSSTAPPCAYSPRKTVICPSLPLLFQNTTWPSGVPEGTKDSRFLRTPARAAVSPDSPASLVHSKATRLASSWRTWLLGTPRPYKCHSPNGEPQRRRHYRAYPVGESNPRYSRWRSVFSSEIVEPVRNLGRFPPVHPRSVRHRIPPNQVFSPGGVPVSTREA